MPQVVQLVGGAGWHHPTLPMRGGDAVQGALIVDVFAGERGGDIAARLRGRVPAEDAAARRAARPPRRTMRRR